MIIRLLGAMTVEVAEQPLPRLRSRQGLRLLALLALRPGQELERTHLAGILWPESAPEAGLALLRRTLTDLRRALGTETERLQAQGRRTLKLDLTGCLVPDAVAFEAAAMQGDSRALELYNGPFLAGFTDDWILLERERLQGLYRDALERRAAQVGPVEATQLLRRALALDPLREPTVRQLMEALARQGDTAGLGACFNQLRRRMRRELGTDPDESTAMLYRQLLRSLRQRTAPQTTPLPLPLTVFFGRDAEREALSQLLHTRRMVTLTGPGGTGKTRLALEVAHQLQPAFPSGVFFVALAERDEPSAALISLAQAVGASEGAEATVGERARHALKQRPGPCLLVLDNLEQLVLHPDAEVLRTWIRASLGELPHLVVLATSRLSLRLAGEQEFPVAPLDAQASTALLLDRVRAQRPGWTLRDHGSENITALCACLEGLPLAVELAAGALRVLTIPQLLRQLERRLSLRTHGREERPERHRSLRAVLEGSYRLLSEQQQAHFAALSVFRGGGSLEAAEAVLATEDAVDALLTLEEHSLLRTEAGRFRMLEVVREFAGECLAEHAENAAVRRRHAAFFTALAEAASQGLLGPDQGYWHQRMDDDEENFRAALDYLATRTEEPEPYLALVAALSRFWERRSRFLEAYQRCAEGLRLHGARPHTELSARALLRMGVHCWRHQQWDPARQHTLEALAFYERRGNLLYQCDSHQNLGNVAFSQGDLPVAERHFSHGLALAREADDRYRIASLLGNLGFLARGQGKHGAAVGFYQEQLELRRALGDLGRVARSLSHLANLAYLRGDYCQARRYYAESIPLHQQFKNDYSVATDCYGLGELARAEGNLDEARRYYQQALEGHLRVGVEAESAAAQARLQEIERDLGS